MKVALVHDYIKEYGGAERVLEELVKVFPESIIYTTLYLPNYLGPHRKRFEKFRIRTSFFQRIPYKEKLISPLRLLSPLAFKSFDLSGYDLIIVSQTGAYFPNLVNKGSKKLITYTHTPPRYLYGYKTAREWKNNLILRLLGEIANHFLRVIDYRSSKNVDYFIANSEEVKERIKKFYRRDSVVINPPVDLPLYDKKIKLDYYLTGGRLARAKGIDIIIEAFNRNGKRLKIFGKGFAGFEEELRKDAKGNIEFVGEISDEEKIRLMAESKAFIFASYDEDFGITPVESLSLGTPVVAFKSGGVVETVREGVTGIFFNENTPQAINEAINKFEKKKFDKKELIRDTQMYAAKNFDKKIRAFVSSKI